jgi:hypothetical protein
LIVGGQKKFYTEFFEKYPAGVYRDLLMGFRQRCGSRMFNPYPESKNSNKRGKKCCPSFLVATNITKLKIILFLNYKTFYPKNWH